MGYIEIYSKGPKVVGLEEKQLTLVESTEELAALMDAAVVIVAVVVVAVIVLKDAAAMVVINPARGGGITGPVGWFGGSSDCLPYSMYCKRIRSIDMCEADFFTFK